MAHAINLTDGTTTISLYSLTGTFVTAWEPAGGGSEREVGETLDLLIQASSAANLQAAARSIELLLDAAERRKRSGAGATIYLTVQWDGEAAAWRSPVLGGRLEMGRAVDQWGRLKVEATLGITRLNYWEGAETQLTLTNSSATNNTAGITIWNHDDAGTGHDNYVEVDAAEVTGSLPGAVKIELKNGETAAVSYAHLWLGVNAESDPANFAHVLEAEAGDTGAGVSVVTATDGSGGQAMRVVTSSGGSNDLVLTVPAATLQKAAGRRFRALMVPVSYTNGAGATVTAALMDGATTLLLPGYTLDEGPETTIAHIASYAPVVELGVFALPPVGMSGTWGDLKLRLRFQAPASTVLTADIDYVLLLPTDSWRRLDVVGPDVAGSASGGAIVDDGPENAAYYATSTTVQPYVVAHGEPLTLRPGLKQRILVLTQEDSYSIPARRLTVRAWYRPRRMSI